MFYSLTGTVVFADEGSVALDCGGVAFRLFTTGNTLRQCAPVGEVQTLYTHLNVREDALDLFGFAEKSELDCFKMLTGVTGVGPKVAQRIVLELKGRLDSFASSSESLGNIAAAQKATVSYAGEDAVNALVMLGYTRSEASIAVGKLDGSLSTEEMIKQALKMLARNI